MKFRGASFPVIAAAAFLAFATSADAAPEVVASIKPVHSLVASVMDGVGAPSLLVGGAASAHSYSLRPSKAAELQSADVVFWVGPEMETFLEKPLASLASGARIVGLMESPGVERLPFREGGPFESHAHEEEAAHDHGHDHEAADAHDHAHDDHAADAGHDDHDHGHAGEGHDAHVWLDPRNARAMVDAIEAALSAADPDNAARYAENARALRDRLQKLEDEVSGIVEPVKGRGFVVFHDAYQYFEKRFDIPAAGSITVSPDVTPGAERIRDIQARIRELGAACVFSEPQFEPKLVGIVTEGTSARAGVLDPLGAALPDGPSLYFDLVRGLATSLRDCLGEAS